MAANGTFTIDRQLVGGQADVKLTLQGPDNAAAVSAILKNTAFPAGKVSLTDIQLTASSGPTIPFSVAGAKDTVSFKATADGFFEAGVYPDPADLLKDLSPERDIASGISLKADAASRFLMLRCGYAADITAKGAMALGIGATVNFGGSASRDASYAVIHEFQNTDGAHDVLASTIKSWILPKQFSGLERLPPRTWVVTELDGSIALNVGVQAGYDYNWLRQIPSGVLKGDLGLKVQLAANAALGFSANGAFAMALSRETDAQVVRLRLFKLAKNGWNFACDASAGEQVTLPDIFQGDKNITDLISAVFGLHAAQLVKDLTDPTTVTPAAIAKYVEQVGMKQFENATGIDPAKLIAAGQAKVDQLVQDWNNLPNQAATQLAAILGKVPDVAKLTTFLEQIQNLDQKGVQSLLTQALSQVDFFQSPIGQWIESVVPTTALGAILGSNDWKTVQDLSGKALSIINGQALKTLLDYAETNLGLNNIQSVQKEIDAFNLDAWLQAKLANFLGKDPLAQVTLADVQKVQKALGALLANADKFYALARQAVQKKYEIDFTATYQQSSTSTALLDVSFDLAANPGLLGVLQQAIDGDLRQLLLTPITGVTLNSATLTHDINRQSHVDLSMPFVDMSADDVSDSLASVTPVNDQGRVLMYTLNAQDEVKDQQGFLRAKSASDSKLSLLANIPAAAGVRMFSEPAADQPSVSCGYTLSKAASAMAASQLQQDLQLMVNVYMPGVFDGGAPLQAWVNAVDSAVDPNHNGILGQTLSTFDVSVSPNAFDPWFKTSSDKNDKQYFALSLAIQKQLRQWIPFYYFASPAAYDAGPAADSVLFYGALQPSVGFDPSGRVIGKPNGDIYINVDGSNDAIAALMQTQDFNASLSAAMQNAAQVLRGVHDPKLQKAAQSYDVTQPNVDRIVQNALKKASATDSGALPATLGPLLLFELDLIHSIVNVAVQLAKFRASAGVNPAQAVKQLSGFGETFVETFNNHLGGNLVAKAHLRPLGSALFLEAGRALAQGASAVAKSIGLFRLTIVDSNPPLNVDDLLTGKFDPAKVKVLLRETLVSPNA